jgi:hypothetical protein
MSKKTNTQEQKEIAAQLPQQLPEVDRAEFEELFRMAMSYNFIASQIKNNTALVPDGQRVASEYEAVARLLENAKNQFIGQKLVDMGYPQTSQVKVDIKTGIITPINES